MRFTRLAFSLLVALLTITPAFAQSSTGTRGLQMKFDNGKVDGLRIIILKSEDDKFVPADPGRSFKKGDEIKVAFESNFDGYVYIVNVTPGGKKKILFPLANGDNKVTQRQRYEYPTGGTFQFDEEKGTEILQVVMSKGPIPAFDDAIKNSSGEMGTSASNAAAELATNKSGIVADNIAIALPENNMANVRSRKVVLAPGKDKDEKGSVVAIPDTKGKQGRLNTGEVAVFEIRLRHI